MRLVGLLEGKVRHICGAVTRPPAADRATYGQQDARLLWRINLQSHLFRPAKYQFIDRHSAAPRFSSFEVIYGLHCVCMASCCAFRVSRRSRNSILKLLNNSISWL